ncbi:ABC transporter permease subunit, partial [Helicobacter sp. CLO-3]|uniref:ABC transporter permease subunit n=2 Tax=Helicobacter TaxID=209 RepID=UPI0020A25603
KQIQKGKHKQGKCKNNPKRQKMARYIFFRFLYLVPLLLLGSMAIFALLRLNHTDPIAQYLLQSNLNSTPEIIAQLKAEFGLDKPIWQQYVAWLKGAVMLDFGASFMSGRSVSEDFLRLLPNTLLLVFCAFALTLIISIPLGIISASYKDRLPDIIARALCFVGVSMPNFWLSFILIGIFCVWLGWLPALGLDSAASLILPCVSIALMSICINSRLIRANMLEVRKGRHVLYAKARGISGGALTFRHIFYNALLPIVTAFGMHIGELIGGALIIESIFALPGIGFYSIQGIANHDFPIIQCFIVVLCVIFALCNLAVDVCYALLDARVVRSLNGEASRSAGGALDSSDVESKRAESDFLESRGTDSGFVESSFTDSSFAKSAPNAAKGCAQ